MCLCRWIAFTDLLQKAKPVKLYKAVDPVLYSKPALSEIREDQMEEEGSNRSLPKAASGTSGHYHADMSCGRSTGEELAAVLPLVRHALEACADNGECSRCTRLQARCGALQVLILYMYIHNMCILYTSLYRSLAIHTSIHCICTYV